MELTYIVQLGVAHIADFVSDRVQSCDLPLVSRTLVANRVTAPLADNFFGAHAEHSHHAEGRLAQLALILGIPFQRLSVKHCRQAEQVLGHFAFFSGVNLVKLGATVYERERPLILHLHRAPVLHLLLSEVFLQRQRIVTLLWHRGHSGCLVPLKIHGWHQVTSTWQLSNLVLQLTCRGGHYLC